LALVALRFHDLTAWVTSDLNYSWADVTMIVNCIVKM